MNVITLSTLIGFWTLYPDAEQPLRAWYRHMRAAEYGSFAEIHADFGSADWVKGFVVFNLGGNKYRLIVYPNFQGKRLYVEAVLTHRQYDDWSP